MNQELPIQAPKCSYTGSYSQLAISIAAEVHAYLFVTVIQHMKDLLTVIKRIHSEINTVIFFLCVCVLLYCFCMNI